MLLKNIDGVLKTLSERYKWDSVYIFGSVMDSEKFTQRSDVDIAVKGLPKYEYYRFVADISSLLERPVDVIELENCAFRETIEMRGSRWEAQAS